MTSNQQWSEVSDFEVLVDARSERRPHSRHNQDVSKKGHPDLNWVFITFTNFFSPLLSHQGIRLETLRNPG